MGISGVASKSVIDVGVSGRSSVKRLRRPGGRKLVSNVKALNQANHVEKSMKKNRNK